MIEFLRQVKICLFGFNCKFLVYNRSYCGERCRFMQQEICLRSSKLLLEGKYVHQGNLYNQFAISSGLTLILAPKCILRTLLLGSMYFWSWLIQLNRSYKYNGKFGCTGISILNGHISKPVALREKLKKMSCNYFSILGRWFHNFPQCIFRHFWLIRGHFWVLEVSHSVTFLPKYAPGSG